VSVPYICGHCEDASDPVTPENGVVKSLNVGEGLEVAIYLHLKCVEAWEQKFGPATGSAVD
jgi:hypothetical protein